MTRFWADVLTFAQPLTRSMNAMAPCGARTFPDVMK